MSADVRATSGLTTLAAAATIALLGGCGSSSPSSGPLSSVRKAADVIRSTPGFRVAMKETVEASGHTMTTQGSGYFSMPGPRGRLTVQVGGHKLEELILYPSVYMHIDGHSFSGKPWASIDLASFASSLGLGGSGTGGSDPSQQLQMLKAAASVSKLGEEAVRAVPTTHYLVSIDLSKLAETAPAAQRSLQAKAAKMMERMTGSKTLQAEVWLDGAGRARRERLSPSICTSAGRVSPQVEIELFDFTAQPAVTAPASSEVADLGSMLNSAIEAELSSLHC